MSYNTFFYDHQIRRFLLQFIRILSNFQVKLSDDRDGNPVYQRVPVVYGDASRQASQILRANSENTIKSVPAMAVHINQLTYDRDRVQEPNFVSTLNIRAREYDPETGEYTNRQGGAYSVHRLMPVPYRLTLKVDVWTSNTEQKLMLMEQIMVLFNPALEIQSTDNYIDWTSLSYVLLTNIDWTNRSVPTGTEETIDISSLTFELPIWISAPAKVTQLGVVQKIVGSIYDANGQLQSKILDGTVNDKGLNVLERAVLTFGNYGLLYQGNTLRLQRVSDLKVESQDQLKFEINLKQRHSWSGLMSEYGGIRNGLTEIRLLQANGSELVGTVALHPQDDSLLLYTPFTDTLPSNTLPPITAIINPQTIDVDSNLISPAAGTRYLLLHGVGHKDDIGPAIAWNPDPDFPLIANANDIIEFNGNAWFVVFDSEKATKLQYVTNLTTGIQYKWNNGAWSKSVEGHYDAGHWSLTV